MQIYKCPYVRLHVPLFPQNAPLSTLYPAMAAFAIVLPKCSGTGNGSCSCSSPRPRASCSSSAARFLFFLFFFLFFLFLFSSSSC